MAAPVFTGLDNNPAYTENLSPVVLDSNATISDADIGASTPFTGATLTLARSGGADPDDVFSATGDVFSDGQVVVTDTIEDPENPGNFILVDLPIGAYTNTDGTLVITFNDQATAARINTVLQALRYANGSEAPPASVTIGYTFDNGEQATGSITVGVTPANDNPAIDQLDGAAFYVPGSAAAVLSPGIVISDIDSPMLSQATVTIVSGFDADDVLSADVGSTGIAANYAAGVLTLSGAATLEQYRQVLATVAYSSSNPDPGFNGSRSLQWEITDSGGLASGLSGSTLDFNPVIDLDQSGAGTGFATTFTEGGAPVAIADSDAVITVSSSTFISALTVVLTNARPGDTLSATVSGGLTASVDNSVAGQVTLTISGSGATSTYEDALRSVTFNNASASVSAETRDVTFVVTDQNNSSVAAHATVTVSAVNDPGSATNDTAATAGNSALSVAAAQGVLANDSDPDGLVVITGNVATSQGGAIQFAADGSYTYTPAADFLGTDTVGYTAEDAFGSQVSATLSIAVGPQQGTQGDDSFTGALGITAIDAGNGIDMITFGFRLVDATVIYQGNTVIIDSASSHTVLSGFEKYVFSDGTVDNNDGNVLVDDLFYFSQYHDVWSAHARCRAALQHCRLARGARSGRILLDADLSVGQPGCERGRRQSTRTVPCVRLAGRTRALAQVRCRGVSRGQPGRRGRAHRSAGAFSRSSARRRDASPSRRPRSLTAGGFDYVYYLQNNPDVAAARVDPLQHFQIDRLAGRAQSERAVRHQRLSCDLHRRCGGARQSARPLQHRRLARGP